MWLLIAASFLFSFSFGLIGNRLAGLPPAWLAAARLTVAAAVFLPFARRVPFRTGAALFAVGMVQFGLMSLTYMASFRFLASHEVALFTVMTPLYVTVLHDLHRRAFHPVNLLAASLAVAGAALILWRGQLSGAPLTGFLLVQTSNLCFAAGQIAYRALTSAARAPLSDRQVFFWLYLGGLTALLPFGLRDALLLAPRPTLTQLAVLVYLGVAVSGLSYFLWNAGARRVSSGVLAVMNNIKIPLGMLVSLTCFGEPVQHASLLAGGTLILAALLPPLLRRKA